MEHCDYDTQSDHDGESGHGRPDCIINLPNKRKIIIDAKAPIQGFRDAGREENESRRNEAMLEHVKAVKHHIKALSAKNYPSIVPGALDYTLMFLPGDSFFIAAINADPELPSYAEEYGVIVVTPMSLIAFLRTVAFGWNQYNLRENAEEIKNIGQELYTRFVKFAEHLDKVGKALGRTVAAYNSAVGSFDRNLLSKAREFETLTVGNSSPSDELKEIEESVRQVKAAESSINEISEVTPEPRMEDESSAENGLDSENQAETL